MRRVVVTIDGPAGAGKSTIAKMLAAKLGYRLLDTGAIYRTVALQALQQGLALDDEFALAAIATNLQITFQIEGPTNRVFVDGVEVTDAIRTPEVSTASSHVSSLPLVRQGLLDLQRKLGADGGVVVEGRDTGTVVFPQAEAKFFLTASDEVRARRRQLELEQRGKAVGLQETMAEMRDRDRRDTSRSIAPLRAAIDAVQIDSSSLSADEIVDKMALHIRDLT